MVVAVVESGDAIVVPVLDIDVDHFAQSIRGLTILVGLVKGTATRVVRKGSGLLVVGIHVDIDIHDRGVDRIKNRSYLGVIRLEGCRDRVSCPVIAAIDPLDLDGDGLPRHRGRVILLLNHLGPANNRLSFPIQLPGGAGEPDPQLCVIPGEVPLAVHRA